MHNNNTVSRRQFLKSTGALGGATFLKIATPALAAITQAACTARDEQSAFVTLSTDEARDFAAIAARLIPTTDTPGATEAGVIHFFDRAFTAEMSSSLDRARKGLTAFNAAVADSYADKSGIADLSPAQQDAFLATRESSEFFNLCWEMTVFGFFAMSKHGGNRDHIGWDLIGFKGHHGAWEYPFGYYDTEYAKEHADGE